MRRFILFFVRLKLGVKKNESFRFVNQKSDAKYGISDNGLEIILERWRLAQRKIECEYKLAAQSRV